MTDVNAIRSNNLLLVNWLNGNDTTPIEQQASSSSNILPEIGMGVAFGIPLVTGQELIGQSKPVSVWQWRKNTPKPDGSKLSWREAWHEVGLQNNLETEYIKKLDNGWFKQLKNKSRFSKVKNIEKELSKTGTNAEYYNEVKKLIAEARKSQTGAELKAKLEEIHKAMAKADARVNTDIQKGIIKPSGKLGKAAHWVKNKAGVYSIKKSLLKSTRGAKALRMASKGLKGTGVFALFEGLFEVGDIYEGYKKDRATGNRQLAKSATKVGASVLGYAAGAAATGAVIGSVCPGIGNVVGGILGFIGGTIVGAASGWLANKATKKVLGESQSLDKSEVELANEEEAKQRADKATENIEEQKILLAEVAEKAKGQDGFDDQALLDAYENILKERETELGETDSSEGAGSVDSTTDTTTGAYSDNLTSFAQPQYDDETQELIAKLGYLASFKATA